MYPPLAELQLLAGNWVAKVRVGPSYARSREFMIGPDMISRRARAHSGLNTFSVSGLPTEACPVGLLLLVCHETRRAAPISCPLKKRSGLRVNSALIGVRYGNRGSAVSSLWVGGATAA